MTSYQLCNTYYLNYYSPSTKKLSKYRINSATKSSTLNVIYFQLCYRTYLLEQSVSIDVTHNQATKTCQGVAIEINAKYGNVFLESVSHHSESGGWSDTGRKESSTVIQGTICKVV